MSDEEVEPDARVVEKVEDNPVYDYYRLASKQELDEEQPLFSGETFQEWAKAEVKRLREMRDDSAIDEDVVDGQLEEIKVMLENFLDEDIESLIGFLDIEQDIEVFSGDDR